MASGNGAAAARLHGGSGTVMGELVRNKDWSQTPLGPIEQWPDALVAVVNLILDAKFPFQVYWGRDNINIYNDALIPAMGDRHPRFLGFSARETFPDIWDVIEPLMNRVHAGNATGCVDMEVTLNRSGYLEETYITFSYSQLREKDGTVAGIFAPIFETTARTLSERRMIALRELSLATYGIKSVADACTASTGALAQHNADTTFTMIYLLSNDGNTLLLNSVGNIPMDHPCVRQTLSIDVSQSETAEEHPFIKPCQQVLAECKPVIFDGLPDRFGAAFPGGLWPESSNQCILCPLATSPADSLLGVLIMGVNPRRRIDDGYQMHFDLIASQVTSAIYTAKAFETERQRSEEISRISNERNRLVSNISHETRTPLTLILGPIEEALQDMENPLPIVQRQRLELMQRQGARLLKLISSLLDVAQDRSHVKPGRFMRVHLGAITSELVKVFRPAIEHAQLELHVNCPPDDLEAYVDIDMWEIIVFNLLSNALKFTLRGHIAIRVSQCEKGSTDDAPGLLLSVEDTGCGINAEDIPRLFERFYRAKNTRMARSIEGTGIGLALVHDLVKTHGGRITVSSQVGQGTTFVVWLPSGKDHLPADCIIDTLSGEPVSPTNLQISDNSTKDYFHIGAASISASYVHEAMSWVPQQHGQNTCPSPQSPTSTSSGTSCCSTFAVDADECPNLCKEPATHTLRISTSVASDAMELAEGMPQAVEMASRALSADCINNLTQEKPSPSSDPELHEACALLEEPIHNDTSGEIVIHWNDNQPSFEQSQDACLPDVAAVGNTLTDYYMSTKGLPVALENRPLVMLVEDNYDMRMHICSILKHENEVIAMSGGQEALDYLRMHGTKRLPDAIVSDVMMHQIDGVSLVRLLRQKACTRNIPVILLSAQSDEEARIRGLQGGADDYLSKPFSSRELRTRVQMQVKIGQNRRCLQGLVQQRTKALLDSKNLYRKMTLLSPVGVYRNDDKGRMTYATRRFLQIVGMESLSVEQIANWYSFVDPRDREMVEQTRTKSSERSDPGITQMEFRFVRPQDGKLIWVFAQGLVDKDPRTGRLLGMVASVSDITQLKQLEADRMQAVKLAEADARQLATEADELRRKQELFVDMVCHEIRNPLNGIVNCVDLIQGNAVRRHTLIEAMMGAHPRAELFDIVKDDMALLASIDLCTNHQRKITDDVLSLSKLSSGSMTLSVENVDPINLLKAIIDMFEGQARSNDLSVSFESTPTSMNGTMVRTDPHRLSQVIINLISNAIKFTANATPVRHVCVRLVLSATAPDVCSRPTQSDGAAAAHKPPVGDADVPSLLHADSMKVSLSASNACDESHSESGNEPTTSSAFVKFVSYHFPQRSIRSSLESESGFASSTKATDAAIAQGGSRPATPTPIFMVIEVRDTGVGMREDEIVSLFQRFRQANINTFGRYGGTGLGLYITKMLVDLMGGDITVQSAPLRGSTFTIILPCDLIEATPTEIDSITMRQREASILSTTAAPELRLLKQDLSAGATRPRVDHSRSTTSPPSASVRAGSHILPSKILSSKQRQFAGTQVFEEAGAGNDDRDSPAPPDQHHLRILVAEDNMINQTLLQRQLQVATDFKCTCTAASNGAEAVDLFEHQIFDVVLMDVEMPIMGGLEAARRIRSIELDQRRPQVPIIGLSGNARDVHIQNAIEAGMTDYIPKPFSKEQLLQAISQSLEKGR